MPREAKDLTGRVFGTRKVTGRAESRKHGRYTTIYWHVRCLECGAPAEVQGGSLKSNHGCRSCYESRPAKDRTKDRTKASRKRRAEDAQGNRAAPPKSPGPTSPARAAKSRGKGSGSCGCPGDRVRIREILKSHPMSSGSIEDQLAIVPHHATLKVHMSGPGGQASVYVRGVTTTEEEVVLHTELPESLIPWTKSCS